MSEEQKQEVLKVLEKNLCVCKVCAKLKQRNLAGRWHGKDKKYVDEMGLAWNGKTCGLCNLDRVRDSMAKMREKRKQDTLLATMEPKND